MVEKDLLPPPEFVAEHARQSKNFLVPTADYSWAYWRVLGDKIKASNGEYDPTVEDVERVHAFHARMKRARAGEPD